MRNVLLALVAAFISGVAAAQEYRSPACDHVPAYEIEKVFGRAALRTDDWVNDIGVQACGYSTTDGSASVVWYVLTYYAARGPWLFVPKARVAETDTVENAFAALRAALPNVTTVESLPGLGDEAFVSTERTAQGKPVATTIHLRRRGVVVLLRGIGLTQDPLVALARRVDSALPVE